MYKALTGAYPELKGPNKATKQRLVKKRIRVTRTFCERNHTQCQSVLTNGVTLNVKDTAAAIMQKPTRKLSRKRGLSKTIVFRTIKTIEITDRSTPAAF